MRLLAPRIKAARELVLIGLVPCTAELPMAHSCRQARGDMGGVIATRFQGELGMLLWPLDRRPASAYNHSAILFLFTRLLPLLLNRLSRSQPTSFLPHLLDNLVRYRFLVIPR